jgi:hypothetical protein
MKKTGIIIMITVLTAVLVLTAACSGKKDTPVDEINPLQIIDHQLAVHEFMGDSPSSTAVITGIAQNTGDTPIHNAVITAYFYTKDGETLVVETATRDNLAPGEKWTFTIKMSGPDAWKAKRYEVFPGSK